jgi:squalene-hopene/tetraprenyl-beta-curcumene cyclase
VIPWLAALPVILASGAQAAAPAYDPSPVDWAAYQKMWLKDFPKATPSEAMRKTYGEDRAAAFLDDASLKWIHQNRCGTCHTTVSYLMARPLIGKSGDQAAWTQVRTSVSEFAAEHVTSRSPAAAFFAASAVAALAVGDAARDRPMQPDTRALFDYLWSSQAPDGAWDFPQKGALPFLERDRPYLALMVALSVGYAPDRYYEDPTARVGFSRLQTFIRGHLPGDVHGKAVLLWASVRTPGLLSPDEQAAYERTLLDLQHRDGGWALPSFGTWPRHDGAPNDPDGGSDGYATSLASLVLCQAGYGTDDPRIRRAVSWIRTHQRVSGRWYTRSLYSDRFQNYLSNMGTAYAVMALSSCR